MFNDIIISQALQKFAQRGCEISALGDTQNAIWEGNDHLLEFVSFELEVGQNDFQRPLKT